MSQELVENIIKSLERLSESDDQDMASVFLSALSSAKASASRALIPNTKVGSLARYSVAASASSTLKAYLASDARTAYRDGLVREVLAAAFKLAPPSAARKSDGVPDVAAPEGWTRDGGGFFTRQTQLGQAEIIFNPHMPGGDWSLMIGNLPVGFGSTPEANKLLLARIVNFLCDSQSVRRMGNPFRRNRNV